MSHAKVGMRVLGATMAFLLVSSAPANPQDVPEEVTKSSLQNMYTTYLTAEGYRPEIDSDGDIEFKHEGKVCYIIIDESDPQFFRLVMPNVWPIESEEERQKVLVATDYSNAKTKVAKAYIYNDNVWICVELFVAKPEDFKGTFSRSVGALQEGLGFFVEKMRG